MKEQSTNLRAAEQLRQTQPAFLYLINHGGTKYFFTNYDADIVIDNGTAGGMSDPQTFTRSQIDHAPAEESAELNSQPVVVMLAANDVELRKYFLTAPTKEISVSIYRINSALLPGPLEYEDLYLEFVGICQSVSFVGYQIDATFLSSVQNQERQIPNFYFQKTCNVPLFSAFCGLNKELHKLTTTCAAVSRANKTIDIANTTIDIGSPARTETITAETFQGGRLRDASNNEIGIVACEPISGGTRLWLAYWPGTLAVSSAVVVYTGCLKIVRVCNDFYENKANFRGMPYIPVTNPAVNSIVT